MPAEPILTLITRNLVETLALVRPPAYRCYLKPELRSMKGNTLVDGRVVLIPGNAARAGGDGSGEEAMGYIEWKQSFEVVCYFAQSDNSGRSIDERLAEAAADIENALTYEEQSFQRGGYAMGTFIDSMQPFDDEEHSFSGILIQLTVEYRYVRGQPYQT